MKTPIDMMLDGVTWVAVPNPGLAIECDLPYTTHEGVFEIVGLKLRCYRLSNGQAVFNADDLNIFLDGLTDSSDAASNEEGKT